ncbi:DUF1295 domain-containing protein [Nocardia cyriacigeorgica]|uniref:DUF1295 domain-containing protein n=1 Tax=Nocardia cyriacigeorgica TaxID=135487 RepID=UPI001892FF47|nr:DUF1295 domain-containing protein [Nocardia cyriacigeorgica]MBF6096489.1 DUF1295 domain-containing protein [Nocardia cyriacigeorgica]
MNLVVVAVSSLIVLAAAQAVTYVIARRLGRYNVVDVTWGLGFVLVALVAALAGDGSAIRELVMLALVGVWGLRLSLHLYRRTAGKGEDPRYAALLDRHGHRPGVALRRVFLPQGLAQWVISLPIQVSATSDATAGAGWLVFGLGVLVWTVGLAFEAVGDHQLEAFRADPRNRGTVMDRGLWAWSRHPNYFGDCCVWWGIWLVAASSWPGVLTVIAPMAMTYVLVYGTGARLLERTMSQRPGYRDYQCRTAYFFPMPPRRRGTARSDQARPS